MSESLSGHNHHNNAKLSNPSENLFYAQLSQNSDNNLINRVYDHMYASETIVNSKEVNATNPNCQSAESEVKFLKDWLILHLDLIQQQNDEILSKEKTILILQQENEMVGGKKAVFGEKIPAERESPWNCGYYYCGSVSVAHRSSVLFA